MDLGNVSLSLSFFWNFDLLKKYSCQTAFQTLPCSQVKCVHMESGRYGKEWWPGFNRRHILLVDTTRALMACVSALAFFWVQKLVSTNTPFFCKPVPRSQPSSGPWKMVISFELNLKSDQPTHSVSPLHGFLTDSVAWVLEVLYQV